MIYLFFVLGGYISCYLLKIPLNFLVPFLSNDDFLESMDGLDVNCIRW